ncbi:MAG: phosphoribosylglycinamide formyltransferase [Bacteroidales bacterium]|nr:phosphoribosylglycinamide formyltransferase [Bacteroidales bacterium]
MKNVAIFASGSGTNAQRIAAYFKDHPRICITVIFTNNSNAYVIERAKRLGLPYEIFSKHEMQDESFLLDLLKKYKIDFIVLAGFLLKIPDYLVSAYKNKIINIHPALLPKYGGKGMYGSNVHKAVIDNKESESGITIHYVNEFYDEGAIIFQAKTSVTKQDTIESLSEKIHFLEHTHFPRVIEEVLKGM